MSIEGQCHCLTLAQGHLHKIMKIKTCFSQKPPGHFYRILYVRFWARGNKKLVIYDAGHMVKMAAMVKILQKSDSLEPLDRFRIVDWAQSWFVQMMTLG